MRDKRSVVRELRGLAQVLIQATINTTSVVEEMHQNIGGGPAVIGSPLKPLVRLYSGPIYRSIRGITGLVGMGVNHVFDELEPVFGENTPPDEYEMVRGALNGIFGDHLAATQNPLAVEMVLKKNGVNISPGALDGSVGVLLYIHGAAMDDTQLTRQGHNHGLLLAAELGLTLITVRYNSGLHISENGAELDRKLDELMALSVPRIPLVVMGFSMGGLVARSAIHNAEEYHHAWRKSLSALVFVGTPHHGAPLERMGNIFHNLLGMSSYSSPIAKLARIRSAGVTDLRYGSFLEEHWVGVDRFDHGDDPRKVCDLPKGVPCVAFAGTTSPEVGEDLEALNSDGLVPVTSALGYHKNPALNLGCPANCQHVVPGTGHLDLLDSPVVYEKSLEFLTANVGLARISVVDP